MCFIVCVCHGGKMWQTPTVQLMETTVEVGLKAIKCLFKLVLP